jgi:hypothetical protein
LKTLVVTLFAGALLFSAGSLKSQFPGGQAEQSPVDALKAMKAINAATIQKQEATLKTLDAMSVTSQQIKIFSKRA